MSTGTRETQVQAYIQLWKLTIQLLSPILPTCLQKLYFFSCIVAIINLIKGTLSDVFGNLLWLAELSFCLWVFFLRNANSLNYYFLLCIAIPVLTFHHSGTCVHSNLSILRVKVHSSSLRVGFRTLHYQAR